MALASNPINVCHQQSPPQLREVDGLIRWNISAVKFNGQAGGSSPNSTPSNKPTTRITIKAPCLLEAALPAERA